MQRGKHTLLASTGASPQIITETLYAIHHEQHTWPDEIFIITTSFGKKKAVQGLLDTPRLQQLCAQLQRPMPNFDASCILVTPDANGTEVEDARSLADHEALANFITAEIRKRTTNMQDSLHISLAGGRKTMTFYMGYAMSLFGRPQDILSHVLVTDGYEGPNNFYYPSLKSQPVMYIDGPHQGHPVMDAQGHSLDAKDAVITLATIPFVRLRAGLPDALCHGDASFIDTVQAIQTSLEPAQLIIYREAGKKKVTVQYCNQIIRLEPLLLAWLIWWAERAQSTDAPQAPREKSENTHLDAQRYLQIYANLDDPKHHPFHQTSNQRVYTEDSARLKSMKLNLAHGIDKKFFEQNTSKLEKSLKKQLGQYQANHYLIHREKKYGQTRYQLALAPEAIFIDLN